MKTRKILAVSPHFDDVALSCSDYLILKKNEGYDIDVITIFTKFQNKNTDKISLDAKKYLQASKCLDPEKFHEIRDKENNQALSLLNFNIFQFNFIDGGFRIYKNKPVYKSYNQLFSGKVNRNEKMLIKHLITSLKRIDFNQYDCILAPAGIGNHVDHLLTRKILEILLKKNKIKYYFEYPYALQSKKNKLLTCLTKYLNKARLSSDKKLSAISYYSSQVNILFPNGIDKYVEIIVT